MSDMFAGNHGPEGVFGSLKGRTLAPHVQAPDVQDQNFGDSRLNQSTVTENWTSHTLVTTGMTRGGGTMVK